MTNQQLKELKGAQRTAEAAHLALAEALKEIERVTRTERQDIAAQLATSRHTIAGAMNLPLNVLAMIQKPAVVTEEKV